MVVSVHESASALGVPVAAFAASHLCFKFCAASAKGCHNAVVMFPGDKRHYLVENCGCRKIERVYRAAAQPCWSQHCDEGRCGEYHRTPAVHGMEGREAVVHKPQISLLPRRRLSRPFIELFANTPPHGPKERKGLSGKRRGYGSHSPAPRQSKWARL